MSLLLLSLLRFVANTVFPFGLRYSFLLRASEGSSLTPAHHYPDFRLKTYAPLAFRYFRELFGIKPDDYLVRAAETHKQKKIKVAGNTRLFHFIVLDLGGRSHHECYQKHHLLFPQYSMCNEPLIELSNPGASSSWFYLTSDDEFIIKTVQHKEAEFLQKLLPGYYMVGLSLKHKHGSSARNVRWGK